MARRTRYVPRHTTVDERRAEWARQSRETGDPYAACVCRSKRFYTDIYAARTACRLRANLQHWALRPYVCPQCGYYHLTSAPARDEPGMLFYEGLP